MIWMLIKQNAKDVEQNSLTKIRGDYICQKKVKKRILLTSRRKSLLKVRKVKERTERKNERDKEDYCRYKKGSRTLLH